jgi:type VII secretion protein EccB
MRKLSVTTISGIMIAIVVAAGAFVVGLLKPGSTSAWRDPGTIIVERETGARYILSQDKLRPTVNYASAVLALSTSTQGAPPKIATVARSKLSDVQRDTQIGILGLPDSLPTKSNLIMNGFAVCAQQQAASKGRAQINATLYLGGFDDSHPVGADDAIYAQTVSDGKKYLLWKGLRFGLNSGTDEANLGLVGQTPVQVAVAFVNAFQPAPDFKHPQIDGVGNPGPTLGGVPTKIGEVLSAGSNNYFMVSSTSGVAAISKFVADLAASGPGGPDEHKITSADIGQVKTERLDLVVGMPDKVPNLQNNAASAVGGACVDYGNGSTPLLRLPNNAPDGIGSSAQLFESDASERGAVDSVILPAGKAAVIASTQPGGGAPATAFIVAEPGKKFAVAPSLLPAFGYATSSEFLLPSNLVMLIPTGPAMDPTAALSPPS